LQQNKNQATLWEFAGDRVNAVSGSGVMKMCDIRDAFLSNRISNSVPLDVYRLIVTKLSSAFRPGRMDELRRQVMKLLPAS
jgi:hypothetical protein